MMKTDALLIVQIRALETQLKVLQARLQEPDTEECDSLAQIHSFADLYGILKGEISSTLEDIRAAEISWEQ